MIKRIKFNFKNIITTHESKIHISKIVFVVGHENWGKSKTLKSLTNGSRYIKNYSINNINWFIRRNLSNDDYPDKYYDFMDNLDIKN
ncbi:MAG: hypothetical protein U5K55_00130 [Aliarcobacter sp.]|nr:hypothetical protein [Aliarcobacter sp.]